MISGALRGRRPCRALDDGLELMTSGPVAPVPTENLFREHRSKAKWIKGVNNSSHQFQRN